MAFKHLLVSMSLKYLLVVHTSPVSPISIYANVQEMSPLISKRRHFKHVVKQKGTPDFHLKHSSAVVFPNSEMATLFFYH